MKNLTIHFMPFAEVARLDSNERIKKLLKIVLMDKIILLQGRLTSDEEVRLIEDTMAMIGHIKGFKGVELAVLNSPKKNGNAFEEIKREIAKVLIGDREAMTIIGPASIVKEIKRDPSKIELMLKKR